MYTKQSPILKVYYKQHVLDITRYRGAEISMVHSWIAEVPVVEVRKSTQRTLQADGTTLLEFVGETHFDITRDGTTLHAEALVMKKISM